MLAIWSFCAVTVFVLILRLILRCLVRTYNSEVEMTGKVVIVTGANSGIGFHTAQDLVRRGARVVLACRDEARGSRARDQIITETGNSNVVYKHLNLSSLSSVRTFCEDIIKSEERLDVLVNNAGAYDLGGRYTDDGIVEVMQVNYFSIFMLTDLLLPMIKERRGRVVNVTSLLQYIGHLNLDHINEKGSELMTYANSKFCLMTFTVELARRLRGSGVAALAVHPGVVRTDLTRSSSALVQLAFAAAAWLCRRSAAEGAAGVLRAAVADECGAMSGTFLVDGAQWWRPWRSLDSTTRRDLWDISEKILRYKQANMNEN